MRVCVPLQARERTGRRQPAALHRRTQTTDSRHDYTFQPRLAKWRGGLYGVSFLLAASPTALKEIKRAVRNWGLQRRPYTRRSWEGARRGREKFIITLETNSALIGPTTIHSPADAG